MPGSSAPSRKRRRSWALDAVLYLFTRALLGFFAALPMPAARRVAMAIGRVALLLPRLNRVGHKQLFAVYGQTKTRAERRAILREAMDNLMIVAAEFPHGPRQAKLGFPTVAVVGRENMDAAKGALLISGHQGNWEWFGGVDAMDGARLLEVVRPLDFPPLDAYVNGIRRAMGMEIIPKTHAAAGIFEALREGTHVGLLIDQSPRENAVPVTFLGHRCWATIGPAMIAARTKVPVHFVTMRRLPDYSYVCELSPALPFVHTHDLLADLVRNTQLSQDLLEEFIRKYPGQWLWFHRRWKPRPRLQEEWNRRLAKAAKDHAELQNPRQKDAELTE